MNYIQFDHTNQLTTYIEWRIGVRRTCSMMIGWHTVTKDVKTTNYSMRTYDNGCKISHTKHSTHSVMFSLTHNTTIAPPVSEWRNKCFIYLPTRSVRRLSLILGPNYGLLDYTNLFEYFHIGVLKKIYKMLPRSDLRYVPRPCFNHSYSMQRMSPKLHE